MRHRIAISASLLATTLCGSLLVQEYRVDEGSADSEVSADIERVFLWFDTLGFPRLADCKVVRVEIGQRIGEGGDAVERFYADALLLDEDEEQFTVFRNLSQATWEKTPERRRSGLVVADLETGATERLRQLRSGAEDEKWFPLGVNVTERAELFVLARACHEAGHDQLANELLSEILSIPDLQTGEPISLEQLQAEIAEDISHVEMWRAVVAFGDPDVSRRELLHRFRRITTHFPQSRYAERAGHGADILSRMVKEDELHAAVKQKPLDQMTIQERVAELIVQLRDQNGHQWSQPGSCNIFADPRDGFGYPELFGESRVIGAGSPASQLVVIGEPALEQLIDAVDDDRFTRCVGYHRNFYFSHGIIRVGGCCLRIIERIKPSGREFDIEGDAALAKRAMKAWYISERPRP